MNHDAESTARAAPDPPAEKALVESQGIDAHEQARVPGRFRDALNILFSIPRHGRARGWAITAWVALSAGLAASALGGLALSNNSNDRSRSAFTQSAVSSADAVTLQLQRFADLGVTTAAFLGESSSFTASEFSAWMKSVHFPQRFPLGSQLIFIRYVPAADLPSYIASVRPRGGFHLTPAGPHPYYCFVPEGGTSQTVATIRHPVKGLPILGASPTALASVNLCATFVGKALLEAANSGTAVSASPYISGIGLIVNPAYRGGVTPVATRHRLASLVGWTAVLFNADRTLQSAVGGYAHLGLTLTTRNAAQGTVVLGTAGVGRRSDPYHEIFHLGSGAPLTLAAAGASTAGPLGLGLEQWPIIIGGIILSLLAWAALRLLPNARDRALELVALRTAELHRIALHDPLTGLANRALVLDRVQNMIAKSRRDPRPTAIMFVDVDDFKDINDTLGHRVGDNVLIEVGLRLRAAIRQSDTVGRLGGDEFIVILEGDSVKDDVEVVANRILERIQQPISVPDGNLPVGVTASIGIAFGDHSTREGLLRDADIALYRAKSSGKSQFAIFEPAMAEAVQRRRDLQLELRQAVDRGEFFLAYRPSIDLGTLLIVAMEATLRWRRPAGDETPPDEMIAALESSGLIVPVGGWMLEQACADAARWNAGARRCGVVVGISPIQLDRPRFSDEVRGALARSGLSSELLILSVPERALLAGDSETLVRLTTLRELGVQLSVINPGYASVESVRRFPLSVLSVDKPMLGDASSGAEAGAFVEAVRRLATTLGLRIIGTDPHVLTGLGWQAPPLPGESSAGYIAANDVGPYLESVEQGGAS